jgi:hypothetical protein
MESAALGRQRFLGKNETDLTGLGTHSSATSVALSCTAILSELLHLRRAVATGNGRRDAGRLRKAAHHQA